MNTSTHQSTLNRGLGIVKGAAAKQPSVPVLANVLLEARQGGLTLTATDLDRFVTCKLRGDTAHDGAVTLPARLLAEVIGAFPKERVTITLGDDDQVEVSCGDSLSKLNGISVDEFPHIPVVEGKMVAAVEPATLAAAIGHVLFAAATDEARPILTGALFRFENRALTIVAADGFRLAMRTFDLNRKVSKPLSAIIPAAALADVARFCKTNARHSQETAPVQVYLSEDYVRFSMSAEAGQENGELLGIEVIARLIEGNFPDYKAIIPAAGKVQTTVTVGRDAFLQALKLPAIFAKANARIIELDVQNGQVRIAAEGAGEGAGTAELPAAVEGPAVKLALNSTFLDSAVGATGEEQVTLGLVAYNSPARIHPAGGAERHMHVLMPMVTTEMREAAAHAAERQAAAETQESQPDAAMSDGNDVAGQGSE
ncbi:MAG: DNA polymerase III subunit beta [Anaerolineae bacterium]|nr:DNA polymerase III subunit beta [Anaerolineae bacterium]